MFDLLRPAYRPQSVRLLEARNFTETLVPPMKSTNAQLVPRGTSQRRPAKLPAEFQEELTSNLDVILSLEQNENDMILSEIINIEFRNGLRNILQVIALQKQQAANLVDYEERKKKVLHLIGIENDNDKFGKLVITLFFSFCL